MMATINGISNEIQFKWDMGQDGFRKYMNCLSDPERYRYDNDYCGAVFFGDMKLEFMTTDVGVYHNLFHYGVEGYAYLPDGTPYEEELGYDDFVDRPRRTFDGFARNIESQVIGWLERYPEMIADAVKPTVADKWYPGWKQDYKHNITREA